MGELRVLKQPETAPEPTDREKWLENRRSGIGGSDAAVILGISPWKSALELWTEKTGLLVPEDISEREYIKWGNILEDPIAQEYVVETERTLIDHGRFALRRHPERDWQHCTIDREILPIDDRGPGSLSIKTAIEYKLADWEEGAPLPYQAQLQHELSVLGWQWGSFAVLIGGNKFRWCDTECNHDFISFLIEKEEEFWDRVQRGNPPDPDASDSAKETLQRLFPKDSGETIELPEEASDWASRLLDIKVAVKELQDEEQHLQNNIRASIGEATFGLIPGGGRYSWKWQSRKAYSVAENEFRVLRRLK